MTKFKKSLSFLYEQFYHYLLYICKHPVCAVVMFAGIIVAYGSYAFATDYYVDSEVVINIPGTSYNWLTIGRYGLVLVRKLLGTSWYNPYYTGILLLLFLWLTGMTFSYVAGKLFPKLTVPMTTLGSLIFLTYPTFTEQYYFHFQSAEIAFGLWLSMLAMGMFYFFVRYRHICCFLCTLPVYVLTFAIYQSFIPLTLCGYLAVFLALITERNTDTTTIKRGIWGSITHFLLAFLISQGINRICFPSSGYLAGQVIWTQESSPLKSLLAVAKACARMLTGQGLFYTTLLLFAILMAAVSFWCCRQKPLHRLLLGVLAALGIAVTPFALTLLMGENTAIRSQFTYGLAAVFLLYFSIQTFAEYTPFHKSTAGDEPAVHTQTTVNKSLFHRSRLVATIVLLVVVVSQISTVRFIWKAHSYVTDYDRDTTTQIMELMYDSHIVCQGTGSIFWGYLQPESPYEEEIADSPSYLFTSVFNLEHAAQPYCYFSTVRIMSYMESMGHTFTLPTTYSQSVSSYIMARETLAPFPEEGCIFNDFQVFTINLGNSPDYYY